MSMIADTLAEFLGNTPEVADKVTGIRPTVAGYDDAWPYLVYETSGLQRLETINSLTNWYEGVIRLHVCTDDYPTINQIAEAIKDNVIGQTCSGDVYRITRIKLQDEDDVAQSMTDNQLPMYVKAIDLWVRAQKIQ